MDISIISKKQAKEIGQTFYFTGLACKNGHIAKRYVNTGICYKCKSEQNKRDNKSNPDRYVKQYKSTYIHNKTKILESTSEWAKNNRGKSNQIKKQYKIRNKEEYYKKESLRNSRKRKEDILFRLNKNISKEVWAFLKGRKQGKTWRSFVDTPIEDIKQHLEKQFTHKMSWENYGSYWEIDHITPLSWFSNENLEESVKLAWSLDNLQPLEIRLNRSKRNRNNFTRKELT